MRHCLNAAVLVVALTVPAAADDGPAPMPPQAGGMAHGAMAGMGAENNPADKAFIAAMRDMMVGMHRAMPTGDTDRDFVRMMVPHHQSAVDMAKAELQYGKDGDLKTLAQAIVSDQEREIALMKAWEDKHPR